ncbi:HD-GYP domain-containing protein [Ruminococcaceae bacterium OttesenSCG-928-L11]|nr:HD-GYP domain-containing protein [Ruminococcaceae bacterium OttesenSCG-928-L11]
MRYVTVSHLKDGMILGQTLLNQNFGTMLSDGMQLEEHHIRKINDLGYGGVYIRDPRFEDIAPSDIVKTDTRIQLIRSARELQQQAESGYFERSNIRMTKVSQDKLIMPVMEEIIANPKRMLDYVDAKPYEDYVYYHSANVVILSLLVGIEMGLSGTQLYELGLSSMLYDLGNIFVPKAILNKPGKLSPEEFEEIKKHTDLGFEYLRNHFDISIEGCMGALQHHEYYDGSGYPNGLKKDRISIFGRIIAITDVYDALTSRRPFRQPMFPATAMDYININSGTKFDPKVVAALRNVVASYPSGICVEMASGARCIVTENTPGFTDRPKLRLLKGLSRTPLNVDLTQSGIFAEAEISHIIEL